PQARALVLMPESAEREQLLEMLRGDDLHVLAASDGARVAAILREHTVDCVVVGPRVPNLSAAAFDPLRNRGGWPMRPSVIFYAEHSAVLREELRRRIGDAVLVRHAQLPAPLLDQAAALLHRKV